MLVRDEKEKKDIEEAFQAELFCENSVQQENKMVLPNQELHCCEGIPPNRVPQTNIPSPALPINPLFIGVITGIIGALILTFNKLNNKNKTDKKKN